MYKEYRLLNLQKKAYYLCDYIDIFGKHRRSYYHDLDKDSNIEIILKRYEYPISWVIIVLW